MRALAAAVRDPQLLRSRRGPADIVDLGSAPAAPARRRARPGPGAAARPPRATRSRRSCCGSSGRRTPTAGWPLHVDPGRSRRSCSGRRASSPRSRAPADGRRHARPRRGGRAAAGGVGARVRRRDGGAAAGARRGARPRLRRGRSSSRAVPCRSTASFATTCEASLGGREISPEEFQALAAATQPLVRIGGEWRALKGRGAGPGPALAAIALHGSSMPAMTALGAALAGRYEVRGLAVEVGDPTGELDELVGRLRSPELLAAGRAAGGIPGRASALPEGRVGVARAHARAGPGGAPRRRHGARKDRAGDRLPARPRRRPEPWAGADRVPDVGARQLAARGAPVRARSAPSASTTGPTARETPRRSRPGTSSSPPTRCCRATGGC